LSESSDAIKDPEAERFFSPAIRERSQRNSDFVGKEQPSTFHTTTNTFIYTYQTHTMAITKRPRDDASADRAAKKHKKGFTVGPQNLPDGTHRRKSTHAPIPVRAITR
jgi:hypothetical protein